MLLQRAGNDASFRRAKANQSLKAFQSPILDTESLYNLSVVSALRGVRCLTAVRAPLSVPVVQRLMADLLEGYGRQKKSIAAAFDTALYQKCEPNWYISAVEEDAYVPKVHSQNLASGSSEEEADQLVLRLKQRPVTKSGCALKPSLKELADGEDGKAAYYDYARHALVSVGLSWIQPKAK